jgi:uncharacterized protein (TIGR02598 family)
VTLALGIFAFAIVAILGLLSASLNSDRGANSDSALTRMAETTVSQLRSQGFRRIHTNSIYSPPVTAPQYYYDNLGQLALNATGIPATAPLSNSVYSCTITRKASASTNLDYLTLEFRWPLSAPEARRQIRSVHASLANEY